VKRFARAFLLSCAGLLLAGSRAFADDAELRRISLPGFSIEVLEGKVISTSASPSEGKHVIELPAPGILEKTLEKAHDVGRLVIEWSSQPLSQDEWKKMLLPTFVDALNSGANSDNQLLKEAASGKDRWIYVMGTPKVPIGFGVINCDTAFSVTVTFTRYRDVERQFAGLSRIVNSVQCAVTDANRVRPIAATRLPAKFGRTPDRDVQIFQALDGEQVLINFTQSDVQRDPEVYRKIVRALLKNALGVDVPDSQLEILPEGSPRPAGKSSLMRANFPATQEILYVGTQYCPAMNLSVISMSFSPKSTDQLARERQSQVGCPGEESTESPSFASIADAACSAGQKQFCGLEQLPE